MYSRYSRYLTSCETCGNATTKAHARKNNGRCKTCVTGKEQVRTSFSMPRKNFNGHCEDAPCCGCCGPQAEPEKYYPNYYNDNEY